MFVNETPYQQGSDEWVNYRRSIITATDVASVIGVSPFQDYFDLIFTKWNILQNTPNKRMEWGSLCESVARDYYKKLYNVNVYEANLCTHGKYEWLGASPDGIIYNENALLEIKCPGKMYDNNTIPDNYYVQMQIQMEVLDADKCYFWVCICEKGMKPNLLYYCENKDISIMEVSRQIVYRRKSFFNKYFDEIIHFHNIIFNNRMTYVINYISNHIKIKTNIKFHFNTLLSINKGEEIDVWFNYHTSKYKNYLIKDIAKTHSDIENTSISSMFFNNKHERLEKKFISSHLNKYQTVHCNNSNNEKIYLFLLNIDLNKFILIKPNFILDNINLIVDFGMKNKDGKFCFIWISLSSNIENDVKKEKWLLKRAFVELAIENSSLPIPHVFDFCLYNESGLYQPILFKDEDNRKHIRSKIHSSLKRWKEIQMMSNANECNINMKHTIDSPWNDVRKEIAYERGEPTLLWGITHKRKMEFKKNDNVKSFWSSKFGKCKTIKKEKKRAPIIMKMIDNEKNRLIPSRKSKRLLFKKQNSLKLSTSANNYYSNLIDDVNLVDDGNLFIDFETVQVNDKSYLFQIGIGYYINNNNDNSNNKNNWRYKSFITTRNVIKNERGLIKRWLLWMEIMKPKRLIHWSNAEQVIYKEICKRYPSLLVNNESFQWIDLLPIFKSKFHELDIKGLFSFSLKQVADVLYRYGYIDNSYMNCEIQNGLDVMLEAQIYFKRNNGLNKRGMMKFKNDVEEYNELDVKILADIYQLHS